MAPKEGGAIGRRAASEWCHGVSHREGMASLDDLLQPVEDELPRERRTSTAGRWFAKSAAQSALIAGLIWGIARLGGFGLPYLALTAAVLALFALARVVREVAPPQYLGEPPRSSSADYSESGLLWPAVDGLYSATSSWDNRLSWTQRDAKRFDSQIRPVLGELVDERLRQRHGLTRTSDPDRARALLGDPLWTFLATPVTRSPTPKQMAAVVQRMEAL